MATRLRRAVLAALSLSLALAPASAHPHMGLTSSFEFVWEAGRLVKVVLDWAFDEDFSRGIIEAYDHDRNGKLDEGESAEVYRKAFSNLKNYDYFTYLSSGGKVQSPQGVGDFRARIEGKILHYRFSVALGSLAPPLSVAVYDKTYFCAVQYGPGLPRLVFDPAIVSPTVSVEVNKERPVYYDPASPPEQQSTFRTWRKGLLTFYPTEVRVAY